MIIPIGEDNDTQFLIKIKNKKNIQSKRMIPVRFVPLLRENNFHEIFFFYNNLYYSKFL